MLNQSLSTHVPTLDERLTGMAQKLQEDLERLLPGADRNALQQKARQLQTAIYFHRLLGTRNPPH